MTRAMLLLACAVSASLLTDAAASLDLKERPVSKVLKMLDTMQDELAKEKEADQDTYDKLSCWCETNGKGKTAAIATANSRIEALTSDIEAGTSKAAQLEQQIAGLKDEIAKNDAALRKADALRQKDLAEFNADEKDLMQSIQSLGNAVTVLSKHHSSFLQMDAKVQVNGLTHALRRANLTPDQKEQVTAFLQQPAGFSSYAPASGQIFGILKQMKETFEQNLAESQKDEKQAAEDFASLKAAKTKEMTSAGAMVDSKTQELADTEEKLAADKQNLADTEDALAADTTFLLDLKERCANADAEFEERTKARNEEQQAVAETIALLNSDAAHDLFGKTTNSFVQTTVVSRRTRAVEALRAAAKKTGSQMLLQLAMVAKLDAFEKVKEAIDNMVAELKVQQNDEVKHRDFCIEEFAENEKQTAIAQDELSDLGSEIEDLKSTISTLEQELSDANAEIADTKTQMKRAGEDRESENAEFQTTVADQRAAQQILTFALNRLKQVYDFAQTGQEPGAAAPPPPEGFSDYKQNKHSGGVLGMIQEIIDESKTMEKDAIRAESDSQAAYESFTKNSNASIKALLQAVRDKTEKKATADANLVRAKSGQSKTLKDLEALSTYKGTLHGSCDFVMDNFDVRQEKRAQEMDALTQAKSILSGAQ
jgi:DNA repair exonuclease SbcCD ATPase subunit